MRHSWLLDGLLLSLIAAGQAPAQHAGHGGHAAPPAAAAPAGAALAGDERSTIDWSHVTDRDLEIAAVFQTARDSGLRPGLDRLRALAARDSAVRDLGHVVAHALGRFAVTQAGGDPAVYAQCREDFQAGCFHGVIEGYFASRRAAAPAALEPKALERLCPTIVAVGSARLPYLECAHGMGHGLSARSGSDFRGALRACDALSSSDMRGECHDGVFMELTVRGVEPRAQTGVALARKDDLRYPCDSVDTRYQPSCWEYQPIVLYEFSNDLLLTVRLCARAPAAAIANCHHGFGKQTTGWLGDPARVVTACRAGDARFLGACVAGAAESYIDDGWTADRALQLCRQAPASAKPDCYRMVGARMALVRTGGELVAKECARAESGYGDVCLAGGRGRPGGS